MQLKCPGCSRSLKIPDSAAGKVVKCPCGKQLRAPAAGGAGAAAKPAASRPAAKQPARPTAPARPPSRGGAVNPYGVDAGLFDELTESDLKPVAVTATPGTSTSGSAQAGAKSKANPYASAMETADASAGGTHGPLASQNKRFLNYFLDGIFVTISALLLGFVVGIVIVVQNNGEVPVEGDVVGEPLSSLLGYGTVALYYIIPEALFGFTFAKLITGTRVVSEGGGKAGFGKILGRTLARFIPFEPLSFFFGEKQTGWHDTLSGTRVIDIRAR